MVRPLQLAAIRAFRIGRRAQRMMRAAHVTARWRGFLFWNGHDRLGDWGELRYLAKIPAGGNSKGAAGAIQREAETAVGATLSSGFVAREKSRQRGKRTGLIGWRWRRLDIRILDARKGRQRQREFLGDGLAEV